MKQRSITSIFIVLAVALAIASTLLFKEIFDIFIAIIAVISAVEMSEMLEKRNIIHNRFMGSMFIVAFYVPIVFCAETSVSLPLLLGWMGIAFVVWSIISWFYDMIKLKRQNAEHIFKTSILTTKNTMLIGIYPCFMLSMFFVINHLSDFANITNKYLSLWMLVMVWAITMLSDTFAYLVGRTFKGPKICPKISPKKTWSGGIGGLLGGVAGALSVWGILHISAFSSILDILNINVWMFVAIGIIGSAISQIGDFFESSLKRKADIKDSGRLFPGHGGMLDRVDALMFCTLFVGIFLIFIL